MTKQKADKPAIFLDRDGVINLDTGYAHRPEDLVLLDGVGEALTLLKSMGYLLIVITNQAGVAKGFYDEQDVERFNQAIQSQLTQGGYAVIDRFYYCPHHPTAKIERYRKQCDCRKPMTALPLAAVTEFGIDLQQSFTIGDKKSDIECGKRLNTVTFQVESKYQQHDHADYYVKSLLEAARIIRDSSLRSE